MSLYARSWAIVLHLVLLPYALMGLFEGNAALGPALAVTLFYGVQNVLSMAVMVQEYREPRSKALWAQGLSHRPDFTKSYR